MKKRILAYLAYIDELLENDNAKNIVDSGTDSGNDQNNDCDIDWNIEMKKHLVQISFFAHERLVHLIVTVLFALMTMATILYVNYTGSMIGLALTVALLTLLIPYIMHYYLLENSVQKMYTQYDVMMNKAKNGFSMDCQVTKEKDITK